MKWRKPSKHTTVETTWKGIFVTCNRGRELQCAREVQQWFETVLEESPEFETPEEDAPNDDVEGDIEKEVAALTSKKRKRVVVHANLGVECVIFAQVRFPIDAVQLTLKLCDVAKKGEYTTKYIQRLGPVQQFIKIDEQMADIGGLKPVLDEHMRKDTKFAIRPTLRLTAVTRDRVIPAVAKLVGPGHSVSLSAFEQLVLVEGFKGVLGIAVLDTPAEKVNEYCRFNIAQIVASDK